MPQDSLKSVVYRSFITCEDPKGVIDCRTIRKSNKESAKLESNLRGQRKAKNLNRSTSHKAEKKKGFFEGNVDELRVPSSFQIMEVSRGAQKLNQVIDSWSKGVMSFNGQSKYIAEDLLTGALDLHGSLMLGRLQDASQYMTKLKKKHKENDGFEKGDEVGIERTYSDRLGNQNFQLNSGNGRHSFHGSSRDCYEELREVIRGSFARQDLLPNRSSQEKAYFNRRKNDLSADIPSTSSSGSSMAYSNDFASSDSSLSSKIPEKKPKVSKLIAKLMGLEEIPSKPLQPTVLRQRRPIFDIDKPKRRKSQFVVQKLDRECMTLEEIIGNMQYKGLLKSNRHQTYHSKTSHLENRFSNDAPPIVIMKPLHPGLEENELYSPKFIQEEVALNVVEMPRSRRTNEKILSKIIVHSEGALNTNEMTPIKKTSKKVPLPKPEDKEVKIKEKFSNKIKTSFPVSSRPQKKELIEKTVDKVQKYTSRRKPVEMENAKSTKVSRSHEQGKVPATKLREPETGSITMRNRIPQQKTTTSNSLSKHTKPATTHFASDQKKSVRNEKPVKEPLATNVKSRERKDADLQIDLTITDKSNITVKVTTQTEQLLIKEEVNAAENVIKENCDNIQNSLYEDTLLITQQDSDTQCPEETTCSISHEAIERDFCETITDPSHLLSRSPSFFNHVEKKLLDLDAYQPIVLQALTGLHDSGIANSRILLDCANELLESRSQRQIPSIHPLLQRPIENSKFCISIDHLMQEVRNGIENLRGYSNLAGNSIPTDIVFEVLERDLWCKGLVSSTGTWEVGWKDRFTVDEVEQIMIDIDKLVLGQLIEEVLEDFVH